MTAFAIRNFPFLAKSGLPPELNDVHLIVSFDMTRIETVPEFTSQ